ncbi:hypothetical protein BH23GEM3_BH23GEM3_08920 [soil metagenome]
MRLSVISYRLIGTQFRRATLLDTERSLIATIRA